MLGFGLLGGTLVTVVRPTRKRSDAMDQAMDHDDATRKQYFKYGFIKAWRAKTYLLKSSGKIQAKTPPALQRSIFLNGRYIGGA
jgi:hypothetical protein